MIHIEPELKEEIIRRHIEDGCTCTSLANEFGLTQSTVSRWVKKYKQEASANKVQAKILEDMEKFRRLQKENEELKKENDF